LIVNRHSINVMKHGTLQSVSYAVIGRGCGANRTALSFMILMCYPVFVFIFRIGYLLLSDN